MEAKKEAKRRVVDQSAEKNFGFDDEQSLYIHVFYDHVAYRYEVLKVRSLSFPRL